MLPILCAELNHREAKIRERTKIYIVDLRMPTEFFDGRNILCAMSCSELSSFVFGPVSAGYELEVYVLIGKRVLLRDSACSNDSDAQLRPPEN
jgi:hypothetical protein